MLAEELGRFGDRVEQFRPTDLTEAVPPALRGGRVGLLWHTGHGQWIIRSANVLDDAACAVEMGQDYDAQERPEDLQIDYAPFHNDVWVEEILPRRPAWAGFGVDHFSRGRVVFEVLKGKFTLFVPKTLRCHDNAVGYLAAVFHLPAGGYDVEGRIYRWKPDLNTPPAENFTVLDV